MIQLVRHAHADSPLPHPVDDRARPLSEKGRRQAELLAVALEGPIDRVLSSPATRCLETVEPLATAHGLVVTENDELAERSDPIRVLAMFEALEGVTVACSHGDVIPEVIRVLRLRGLHIDGAGACEHASVWSIDLESGVATYRDVRRPATPRTGR